MRFAMTFLYSIPALLLLVAALTAAIALSGAGQAFVHRLFPRQDFIAHNEVGGVIIAVSGTLYAVILGFFTVVAWQHYVEARALVVQEADASIDAWHTAIGLPDSVRDRVRTDMVRYATIMIGREWPRMKTGGFEESAAMVSMDAIDAVGELVPADSRQSNAQVATLQQLGILHDARQQRITADASGVSGFEWIVLLIGGFCIIAFCWLFGVSNPRIQFVMTSTVVTIIVSTLVLLFELQYPFESAIRVGPEAWTGALAHIHEMQTGTLPGMRMRM